MKNKILIIFLVALVIILTVLVFFLYVKPQKQVFQSTRFNLELTLPAYWVSVISDDQRYLHFFENKDCTKIALQKSGLLRDGANDSGCEAFEIEKGDIATHFIFDKDMNIDSRIKLLNDSNKAVTKLTDLIEDAVVLRYNPPPMAQGYKYAYEIYFTGSKVMYGVFSTDTKLEKILSTMKVLP